MERYLTFLEDNIINEERSDSLILEQFDPNGVDKSRLMQMNLPKNVVDNLIKYREKGGYFKQKDQLLKIYGLNDSLYELLAPYVKIETQHQSEAKQGIKNDQAILSTTLSDTTYSPITKNVKEHEKKIKSFDLNLADTTQLKQVYGIGEVLSTRIIRYRQALGGFVNEKQLSEVYGLPTEAMLNIQEVSFISQNFEPAKININLASVSDLVRHPYLDYESAISIVNYRSKNGPFKHIEKLKESKVLNEDKLKKLSRYLSFGG
ncbi:MAG: helix-hairpin-helix domain-containing protein [Cyclobacteriaceae bacterium]